MEIAEPLSPAPPSLRESLEVLRHDGVVRLNPDAFCVEENLCAALRDRILAEIENPGSNKGKSDNDDTKNIFPGHVYGPEEEQ